jgi:hypothetical protein
MPDDFEIPEVYEEQQQPEVDAQLIELARTLQNTPGALERVTSALAGQQVPQQFVQPSAPVIPDWENPEVIDQLNALQFSDQTEYNRRIMDLSTRKAMAQMQPQMLAAQNSSVVDRDVQASLNTWFGESGQQLSGKATEYVQRIRSERPDLMANPSAVKELVYGALKADAFDLMTNQTRKAGSRAPQGFGSSQGGPVGGGRAPDLSGIPANIRALADAQGLDPVAYYKRALEVRARDGQ